MVLLLTTVCIGPLLNGLHAVSTNEMCLSCLFAIGITGRLLWDCLSNKIFILSFGFENYFELFI